MIGRTLKRLFNTQISSLILNHQEQFVAVLKQEQEIESQLKDIKSKRGSHIILNQSDISSSNNRRNLTINELEQRRDAILKEKLELNQDMLDFMNLVFGRGQEHDEFFNDVVFLETSIYYDFKLELLRKHPLRLNALYYALLELIQIRVTPVEQRAIEVDKSKDNRGAN
jgi:uncharacterized membrane protein